MINYEHSFHSVNSVTLEHNLNDPIVMCYCLKSGNTILPGMLISQNKIHLIFIETVDVKVILTGEYNKSELRKQKLKTILDASRR